MKESNIWYGFKREYDTYDVDSLQEIRRCLQIQIDAMGNQINKLQTRIDELERKIEW